MTKNIFFLILFVSFSLTSNAFALPTFWNLPKTLNDNNATIFFDVDSTWHEVHGSATKIKGKIWLEDPRDFTTIRGEVAFPVLALNTQNESRDENLRRIMAEDIFKLVNFKITSSKELCNPIDMNDGSKCLAEIRGALTIRETAKDVYLPLEIVKKDNAYIISGDFKIDWREYGVEDPSILIAKVDPIVTIKVKVVL